MTTAPIGPWTYQWQQVPRPFVHPVRTPSGRVLSVDAPDDHPWQHALWFTIKFVNGENFWEEYGEFGTLRQVDAPALSEGADGSVTGRSRVAWVRPDDATVVANHELILTHRPEPDQPDAYVLDWDVVLTPTVDVELDRTPYTTWGGYGGLTLRGRADWHDTSLRLSTSEHEHEQVLGERAAWCALDGSLTDPDGEHEVGVVMLDHPDNAGAAGLPDGPVPWYASTRQPAYGIEGWTNFLNAAFLWDGPLTLAAGRPLRLRYRFVVHDGRWDRRRIEATASAWDEWCEHRGAEER